MTDPLDKRDLQRFARRPWQRVREAKERFWAEQTHREGPQAGLRASEAMWLHARLADPAWPDAEQRREDLDHHVRMSERMRRLRDVFPRP